MMYLLAPDNIPLHHISSGQVMSEDGFVHPDRVIDTAVLIVGLRGTFYVQQGGVEYAVGPDQFMLLLPRMRHLGTRPTRGPLSYYWCHFRPGEGEEYRLAQQAEADSLLYMAGTAAGAPPGRYLLPEYGRLNQGERVGLLFRQLLDTAGQQGASPYRAHYALSLLAMELSADFAAGYQAAGVNSTHKSIAEIMEWIQAHHAEPLSVKVVADRFGYNANYLSGAFKKYARVSLLATINRARVAAAKRLLLDTADPVKTVSAQVGFKDEKHFMKTFKALEGITPSQYRKAFYRRHLNR